MRLTITRDELRDAIANVQSVVSARSTLPMLQYVLLTAEDGSLKLIATDLEVGIECVVDCEEVGEKGNVTVPCKRLHEVVSNLPPGTIDVTVSEGNIMTLTSGVVEYKLMGMPPDDFPKSPAVNRDSGFSMPQADLKEMLKKVSFSISVDPNRPNISGLLLAPSGEQLKLVTTDGRRLSLGSSILEKPAGEKKAYLIPRKTVLELERLLGAEGDVNVFLSENQVAFEFANLLVISNLIDGVFPNYEQVIPRGYEKKIVSDKEHFMMATRRAQVMTTDRYNLVRFEVAGGKMTVRTNCPEVGEVKDEIEVDYNGEKIEVGFDPRFVLEVLKAVEEEKVCMELKDGQSSGVFRPVGNDGYIYVIMPIRL